MAKPARSGVINQEEGSPRGVKRLANEDWPIGSELSQRVVANSEEVPSTEVATEDEAGIHPF